MRAPAIPLRHKLISLLVVGLLACGLMPMVALADELQNGFAAGPLAGPGYEGDARSASVDPPAEGKAANQLSSQDEAPSGVASSLLGQSNASTDFAPQLTAMVALSFLTAPARPASSSSS